MLFINFLFSNYSHQRNTIRSKEINIKFSAFVWCTQKLCVSVCSAKARSWWWSGHLSVRIHVLWQCSHKSSPCAQPWRNPPTLKVRTQGTGDVSFFLIRHIHPVWCSPGPFCVSSLAVLYYRPQLWRAGHKPCQFWCDVLNSQMKKIRDGLWY
jgi:hypothetical protein